MSKGERTKEQVIQKAAALFNQVGYQATSISDVMQATGLQKGGIYRHFESKEALGLAAFDYAVEEMRRRFDVALQGKTHAQERLEAIVSVYARIPHDPPVPGGCPILNAAVEADDTNPALQARAQSVLNGLQQVIESTIRRGQQAKQLRPDVSPTGSATVLISTLEGAVMMSKLHASRAPMRRVVTHLNRWIKELGFDLASTEDQTKAHPRS